jgi:hypothetical protein
MPYNKKTNKGTAMTFDFETEYHWGALMVKLVPMFGFKLYKNKPDDGYHVPARNLSTYPY